jgi:conjugal transfer/type IV secretion protein DotA/TraY
MVGFSGGGNKQPSQVRGAIRYAFLPGIIPRVRRLGQSFGHFAYVLALIFRSARLLPAGHPMLNATNIGRFGFLDVVSAAANNLVVSRKNIDQIMIFGAIVLAVIMIFLQVIVIGFYAVLAPGVANAQDGMFTSPNPDQDVVLSFLQEVIGLDGFFNGSAPVGFSIASALHAMLGFYSTAMMIIATIIVVYYVITVVGESAQTGKPFGNRFNGLWAPIRLVLALGLLVPLGNNLNASQYIVLTVAKMGSGMATQAWNTFGEAFDKSSKINFIAPVEASGFTTVGKYIFLYEVCAAAYNLQQTENDMPKIEGITLIFPGVQSSNPVETVKDDIYTWQVKTPWTNKLDGSLFSCGSIKIPHVSKANDPASKKIIDITSMAYGAAIIDFAREIRPLAQEYAERVTPSPLNPNYNKTDKNPELSDSKVLFEAIRKADQSIRDAVTDKDGSKYSLALLEQVLGSDYKNGGWGNAATFYMKIAFANQRILELVKGATPTIMAQSSANAMDVTIDRETPSWFEANISSIFSIEARDKISPLGQQAQNIRSALILADRQVTAAIPSTTKPLQSTTFTSKMVEETNDGNPIVQILTIILGGQAFVDLADPEKQNITPMVLLSNIGGALISKSIIAFGTGALASAMSGLPVVGGIASALGALVFLFGFIGLSVGFLLYYVLPFLPFVYFFFAIVEWGMGVLEGMVGAPLWALAHLRIDGEGMPGQAAMNGYNILFGMLLRPFLILFSLLASYIMFNAGAHLLNRTFGNVVGVVTETGVPYGAAPLGYVGYLIMYAIIAYNLGLVCFKMIDQIPAQIMRWIGQSNLQYQDGKPDPLGNMQQATTAAGAILGSKVADGLSGVSRSAGGGVIGGIKSFDRGARAMEEKASNFINRKTASTAKVEGLAPKDGPQDGGKPSGE